MISEYPRLFRAEFLNISGLRRVGVVGTITLMKSRSSAQVPRWKCICAYDGTTFHGWQSQEGGNTIQDLIERQLRKILGERIQLEGSGRTDSGVHALGQVFHFDAAWSHGGEKLRLALQSGLPRTIQLKNHPAGRGRFPRSFCRTGKGLSLPYLFRRSGSLYAGLLLVAESRARLAGGVGGGEGLARQTRFLGFFGRE